MICRNCSADIDPTSEKCPYCRKDPRKRNRHGSAGIIIVIVLALVTAAAIYVGFNFEKVKGLIPSEIISVFAQKSDESEKTEPSSKTTVKASDKDKTTAQKPKETKTTVAATTAKKTTSSKTTAATTAQTTEKPKAANDRKTFNLLKTEIKEFPIRTASGAMVSKRGLINANKEQLKKTSQAKFGKFCLQKVSRSPYSWLTIKFSDSTGIVFTGNCATSAVYCKLGKDDYIGEVLGTIILSSGGEYVYNKSKNSSSGSAETATVPSKPKSTTETKQSYTVNKSMLTEAEASKPKTSKAETTAAKTTKVQPTKAQNNSSSVYITDSGKKYHKAGCSSLSKSKHKISLSDAKSKGYTACKRCNP